jgi:hypothetical protein
MRPGPRSDLAGGGAAKSGVRGGVGFGSFGDVCVQGRGLSIQGMVFSCYSISSSFIFCDRRFLSGCYWKEIRAFFTGVFKIVPNRGAGRFILRSPAEPPKKLGPGSQNVVPKKLFLYKSNSNSNTYVYEVEILHSLHK